jgi:hypothetical protein
MTSTPHTPPVRPADLLGNPLTAVFWWGLPLAAGWSGDLLPIAPVARTLIWAAALAWMGIGCALNALRCGRAHCYISAPLLLVGSIGVVVCATGYSPLGPHTASVIINTALGLALLSFLSESLWSKHLPR